MYDAYRRNEAVHVVDEVFWSKTHVAIPVEYWARPILVAGVVQGAIATFVDITQRKLADARIHQLAFYDALTMLPNRRLLNDRLDQALALSKRTSRYEALMFLDLDNFKPLNDSHGHRVGDLLLVEVGERISKCVRSVDTVARFGGDEFVALLNELDTDAAEACNQAGVVAEKIRAALSQPYRLKPDEGHTQGAVEHRCTASIGVIVFNWRASAEELLKCADMAMYESKNAGRDVVVLKLHGSSEAVTAQPDQAIMRLIWQSSYCCGEPTLDQAHRRLFALSNTLIEAALSKDEDRPQFDAALEALLAHVGEHFAEEEAILAQHHYAGLEAHARAHRMLIGKAVELREKASQGSIDVGDLVNFLVTDVIAQHMLKVDRLFFPLFKLKVSASSEGHAKV
jgi:diguanylate cyclase (GGDEF)-like protein/hemerythrin-like metal-binding protein